MLALLLLVAACSPADQTTATAAPTSRFATVSGPLVQRTLPPTWTPSPTASVTPTPSITPTFTLTPTPSADDICAGFRMLHDVSLRRVYRWESYMPIIVVLENPAAMIRFQAENRETGEVTGFEMPGGQTIGASFHMNALPTPGLYDWTLSARSETYGDICQMTGSFFAMDPAEPIVELTAETTAEPEATEEPTAVTPE